MKEIKFKIIANKNKIDYPGDAILTLLNTNNNFYKFELKTSFLKKSGINLKPICGTCNLKNGIYKSDNNLYNFTYNLNNGILKINIFNITISGFINQSNNNFPWYGGNINGYYYWAYSNPNPSEETFYVNTTENVYTTNSFIGNVDNILSESSIPSNTNCIYTFSGYADVQTCVNYNLDSGIYGYSQNYFSNNGYNNGGSTPYLICMTIGGQDTIWNSSIVNQIYNDIFVNPIIYYGDCSYENPNYLSATHYNSIMLDIEQVDLTDSDLITSLQTLFTALKNSNWITGISFQHNSIVENNTGNNVTSFMNSLLTLNNVDYFSPQLYSNDWGLMNEYTATYNSTMFTWNDFYNAMVTNTNFANYGTNMILLSLFFTSQVQYNGNTYEDLYYNSGTNFGYKPYIAVLASFPSYENGTFPNSNNPNFSNILVNSSDPGGMYFFTNMFLGQSSSSTCGGAIAFADNINNVSITN